MNVDGRTLIVVPPLRWERFKKSLLATRRSAYDETLGFILCRRHESREGVRYLAVDDIAPITDDYERQSTGTVALGSDAHARLLEQCIAGGLHPVHVHTHPSRGEQRFSGTDDAYETAYAVALAHLPTPLTLLSIVLDVEGCHPTARVWRSAEHPTSATLQTTIGGHASHAKATLDGELNARQQVFGAEAQRHLGAMHVAIVGCGGIGAVVTELTARLGVRTFTFVDFDVLERSNLNRIPGATARHVRMGRAKVDHAARLVRQVWGPEAWTRTLRSSIDLPRTQRRVAEADVIVVATDDHASRLASAELASRFLRPVILAGSHIDVAGHDQDPRMLTRVTMPPLDGGWCPACAGVVSLNQAAVERADAGLREMLRARGYLEDAPAPAVYWLNAMAASLTTRLLHGMAIGSAPAAGIDWILDAGQARWFALDHEAASCWYCDPSGEVYGAARCSSESSAAGQHGRPAVRSLR